VAARVLLTVSGTIPEGLADEVRLGRRPRADYLELAAALGADLIDHAGASAGAGRVERLLRRVGGATVGLALACLRRRRDYDVVFTDSEAVGMLYAALSRFARRRPRHVMIGHRLSAGKKVLFHRLFGVRRAVDLVLVYASRQRQFAIDVLGYRPDDVVVVPFMVDTGFWRPDGLTVAPRPRPMICSAGQELRDYPTLVEAARDLDVDVVLAAASPWSKRADTSAGIDIPANVTVTSLSPFELRQLYGEAALVVVPIQETDFQAGITTILEAMSMSRPVICTRTEGQTDTIVDGETGVYVPIGDVAALRAGIRRLTSEPDEAGRLAEAALRWVRQQADIEVYAARLAALVAATVERV
jgi:glycosyltransferase involved in cell wall biosynthesis